jgi:two-component system, chemotaxis family, sensor kinase Cph1
MQQENHHKLVLESPNSIQPWGVLLGIDQQTNRVTACSANVAWLTDKGIEDTLGKTPKEVLGFSINDLKSLFYSPSSSERSVGAGSTPFLLSNRNFQWLGHHIVRPRGAWDITWHVSSQGLLIIECLPAVSVQSGKLEVLFESFEKITTCSTLESLYKTTCEQITKLTHYGYVTLYRFESNCHISVEAEHKVAAHFCEYHVLHLPSSYIPKRVRQLYTASPLNVISSKNYSPVAICRLEEKKDANKNSPMQTKWNWDRTRPDPLDLSFCLLRPVFSEQLKYLDDMNAHSAMSLSVMAEGKLWGMLTCYNDVPSVPSLQTIAICRRFSQFLSQQIEVLTKIKIATFIREHKAKDLVPELAIETEQGLAELVEKNHELLMRWFNATGLIARIDGQISSFGECGSDELIKRVLASLSSSASQELFHCSRIKDLLAVSKEELAIASGILAVWITTANREGDIFVLVRPQYNWGVRIDKRGASEKSIKHNNTFDVSKLWEDKEDGESTTWLEEEILLASEVAQELRRLKLAGMLVQKYRDEGRAEALSMVLHDLGNGIVSLMAKCSDLQAFNRRDLALPVLQRILLLFSEISTEEISAVALMKIKSLTDVISDVVVDRVVYESERDAGCNEMIQAIDHVVNLLEINRTYIIPSEESEFPRAKLSEVVEHLSIFFPRSYRVQGGSLTIREISKDIEVGISKAALIRVLMLLLKNSITACSKQGVIPEISIDVFEHVNDQEVELILTDNGVGFAKHSNPLFKRAVRPRARFGSGMGFFGCLRLLQGVGGDFFLESDGVGFGAKARVFLPLKRDSEKVNKVCTS